MWECRAGTCEGVSGTGIFFSTRLTFAGSLSSSLNMFLWGQPTWKTGRLSWRVLQQPHTLPSLSELPVRSHSLLTTFRELPGSPLTEFCEIPPNSSRHATFLCWLTSCQAAPTALVFTGPSGDFPALPSTSLSVPHLQTARSFSTTHHHLLIDLDNLVSWQDLGAGGSLG